VAPDRRDPSAPAAFRANPLASRLVKELIRLATGAESEAVRVAAIKEMFDRGFGKAAQPIEGSMTYGVSQQLSDLFKENAGNTWCRDCVSHCVAASERRAAALTRGRNGRCGIDCYFISPHLGESVIKIISSMVQGGTRPDERLTSGPNVRLQRAPRGWQCYEKRRFYSR
jgi:hypothetical protein